MFRLCNGIRNEIHDRLFNTRRINMPGIIEIDEYDPSELCLLFGRSQTTESGQELVLEFYLEGDE